MFVGKRLGDCFYFTPGKKEPVFHEQLLSVQPMCEPPHLIFINHHLQSILYFFLNFTVERSLRGKCLLVVMQLI